MNRKLRKFTFQLEDMTMKVFRLFFFKFICLNKVLIRSFSEKKCQVESTEWCLWDLAATKWIGSIEMLTNGTIDLFSRLA